MKTAAAHRLTVDFHGACKPTGLRRAYFAALVGGTTTLIEMCCPARKDDALAAKYLTATAQYVEMYRGLVGPYCRGVKSDKNDTHGEKFQKCLGNHRL